ncbi:uncharacterized protein LOC131636304 [Vicia villosa]|uniref:uncharacterized protein LOC131636304 n=1 Tax=Vicia villosa TaxID=3911 RepID=UPI00273CDDC5|nr:uncharacterized protein LOC131636304 [Vicia villosa]
MQDLSIITNIIKEKYTQFWPSYGAVHEDDKEKWFQAFKEYCIWDVRDEAAIKENFHSKCAARFSDTMRNVRLKWEAKGTRPRWIGEDIFPKLIDHWNSDKFKEISEQAKKNRASEVGGCNYAAGSISVAEVARRMREELGRTPLLNELHMETHLKRNGEFIDERAKITQENFDKELALKLSEHPEIPEPPPGYPVDPSIGFQTWYKVSGGKKKNGRVYCAGGYSKNIKRRSRDFKMRYADGEGSSTPPILTAEMLETVRNLANTEAAQQVSARNLEIEEMKRKQLEMQEEMQRRERELREEMRREFQEELRRQAQEYQEAMRIANERSQRFDQFFASQNMGGGGFGGTSGYGGADEEEEEQDGGNN